ncbi:MAG: hypothetical protein EPN93_07975 [Spirochaetes bacterium]|nr:MAG: hypothetical protein EPN93_07975 [Spirochaetota bacterium]
MLSVLPICCSTTLQQEPARAENPLAGTWRYEECTIKNTSVRGTISFSPGGNMQIDAVARDDCPVPKISGRYNYRVQGNVLKTDYDKGYGLSPFFLVKGDYLYFSRVEIKEPFEEWDGGRLNANWIFKLKRER